MKPNTQTFRVIGKCADGSRTLLEEGLTAERAREVRRLLLDANAFREVLIEPEKPGETPSATP